VREIVFARLEVVARLALVAGLIHLGVAAAGTDAPPHADYRVPQNPDVVALLTGTQVPSGLLHAASGRAALVYRETLVPVERIARPHLGLAGFWFEPLIRTSGYDSWIERVVVLDVRRGKPVSTWAPAGAPALDHVAFSPDGRRLSAITFRDGAPRLVIFDIDRAREQVLPVAVNPAFESPCDWTGPEVLLCRIVTDEQAPPPAPFPSPNVIEHPGGAAPTRTYGNLLDSAWEEALFEHYFRSTLAVVDVAGGVRRLDGTSGLLARVRPSPDGLHALVIRVQRPYSHFLKAQYFGRQVEIWDLGQATRLEASALPQRRDVSPTKGVGLPTFVWKSGAQATLGWTEAIAGGGERWVELDPPYAGTPREVTRNSGGISVFGWTSQGTPTFSQRTDRGIGVRYFVVRGDGSPQLVWEGAVKDLYSNPGSAVRVNGSRGPILEHSRRIFLASDGLGPEGPQPFVTALDLDTLASERISTAPEGVYERLVGIVDPGARLALTVRESEIEPPQVYAIERGQRRRLALLDNPFPQLDKVERRIVQFKRKDGVQLSGMLYLPRNRAPGKPLPTLVWIYPAEFSDEEFAEQVDARRYRFHQIKEASPIAAVLEGYALLLNPTVPIIGEGETANDTYVPQLVSSMEAAIDYLANAGISDRKRMAVAGRSYGAFSTANLLVHTDLFRTGIAISGAYNRTLTPFGFQHEKRSFWEATDFYTRMSPFYRADEIREPLLLMHGGADDNPGTPTLQARRFFHALVGNGVNVRYVELPYERHHYRARENVLHTSAEMLDWLDRTIGPKRAAN
jgi:dipeptidyl aminopeptidase/acylaminoacyl peptidase